MTQANVIIAFPQDKVVRLQIPIKNNDIIKKIQKHLMNTLVEENANLLAYRLGLAGINIGADEFQKNYALTIECLRATLYKSLNLHHPLQLPIEKLIEAIEFSKTPPKKK